ncbi:hypothetical protein SP21_11 [Salmonella phage 21]|nr:hypothetical protein SP21_11 [Salmonella phage 21]
MLIRPKLGFTSGVAILTFAMDQRVVDHTMGLDKVTKVDLR